MEKKAQKIDQMTLDCLLAEYQQLYEHNRHDNNIGSALQGILATSSFAILVYIIGSGTTNFYNLILASVTSILLYVCYLIYFEHLRIIIGARFERIAEIEDLLSGAIHSLKMDFIRNFEQRVAIQREKDLSESRGVFEFISKAFVCLSGVLSQRFFRIGFLFLLIALWVAQTLHCTI